MKELLAPTIILLLFICVRSGDIAITSGKSREGVPPDFLRALIYGLVALLALIALVIALVVH